MSGVLVQLSQQYHELSALAPEAVRPFMQESPALAILAACSLLFAAFVLVTELTRRGRPSVPRAPFAKFADFLSARSITPGAASSPASKQGLATFTAAPIQAPQTDVFDAVVVGGGVCGCAAAYALGKQGRRVLLIERDLSEPDKIIGELMQPDGIAKLKELGLEQCVEDIESPLVEGYSLWFRGTVSCVSYPNDEQGREVRGRGFHHGRFITRMRRAVATLPNVTIRQGTVDSLIFNDRSAKQQVVGVKYDHAPAVHAALIGAYDPKNPLKYRQLNQSADSLAEDPALKGVSRDTITCEAYAPLTFVIDGCFSKFRKDLMVPDHKPSTKSSFLGLMLKDCKLPYPAHGLVCLTDPTPAVIYPISKTEVRALISFPAGAMAEDKEVLKSWLRDKFAPQLPESIQPSVVRAAEEGFYRSMPNQYMSARPRVVPGAVMIGDSFNMRHPFTGGGMTCGLSDVVLLTNQLASVPAAQWGADLDAQSRRVADFYARREHNSSINMLSLALYEVCSASAPELRDACFEYLNLGPEYFNGPVSLLAGRTRSQNTLLYHFFSVALFGVRRQLGNCPTPARIWSALRMLRQAVSIIAPLVESEQTSLPLLVTCRLLRVAMWA